MTWAEDRATEFQAMLDEWGTTLEVGALTARCQKTPDRTARMMLPNAYQLGVSATFDIFTSEWTRIGLDSRKRFTCGAFNYEIVPYNYDVSDVTIQFTAERVK